MKRSDYWFFGWIYAYLIVGFFDLFVYRFAEPEFIEIVWLVILSLPIWFSPVARWLHMRTFWQ